MTQIEDPLRYLRVGIYASRFSHTGLYLPATEIGHSSWQERVADAGPEYAQIVEARRQMELALDLVRDGRYAVSAGAVLLSPPWLPGAAHGLIDLQGYDTCAEMYGPYLHVLRPEVLERTLFVLGDSHNEYARHGRLDPIPASEAARLLALRRDHGTDQPYIEALILGGVDLSRDLEQVMLVDDATLDEIERL